MDSFAQGEDIPAFTTLIVDAVHQAADEMDAQTTDGALLDGQRGVDFFPDGGVEGP